MKSRNKKMKAKKQIDLILGVLIFALGVAATLMLFLPGLVNVDTGTVYSGSQVVFGTQITDFGVIGTVQIEPSVMGIIAYILPAVAGLMTILIKNKTVAIISAILFGAAAVMFFLIPTTTVTTLTLLGATNTLHTTWAMSGGLIAAAIVSIFGAVVSLYKSLI
jgi:hypothetical protein